MFKFFLKKNFADGWDNFFFLIISNLIPIAAIVGTLFLIRHVGMINPILPSFVFILCGGIVMSLIFAWGGNAAKIANFETGSFGHYFISLSHTWIIGFLFGIIVSAAVVFIYTGISFYISSYMTTKNMMGLLFTAVLGWFTLICAVALQWFIPLYFLQAENNFVKCLKKSFIIFFDNPGFSFAVFLYNIVLFVISCITVFIVPGVNGILLSSTNALRLRLYKYDWFEKMEEKDPDFVNNRDKREEVPWNELIADDVESLGPRNLASFLFPWK